MTEIIETGWIYSIKKNTKFMRTKYA